MRGNNADFEFLTDVKYTSKDGDIIISNVEKQLPIAIQVNKTHYIGDEYVPEREFFVWDSYGTTPRFYGMTLDSEQSQLKKDYEFNNVNRLTPYGDNTLVVVYNVADAVGNDVDIVFLGRERTTKPQATVSVDGTNFAANWEGDNLRVKLFELEKNKKLSVLLKFEE